MTNFAFSLWIAFSVPTEIDWTRPATNVLDRAFLEDFGNFIPRWGVDMPDTGLRRIPRAIVNPADPEPIIPEPLPYPGQF